MTAVLTKKWKQQVVNEGTTRATHGASTNR